MSNPSAYTRAALPLAAFSLVVVTACGPTLGAVATGDGTDGGTGSDGNAGQEDHGQGESDGTRGSSAPDSTGGDPDGSTDASVPEGCGNATLDPGEVCDDGNTINEDGCNADCQPSGTIEWMTTPDGTASLLGVAIATYDQGGVGAATATHDPTMVLTRYSADGDAMWSVASPPDMILDALATTATGQAVWALRTTNGATAQLVQALDPDGSLAWSAADFGEFSIQRVDGAVRLTNGEVALVGFRYESSLLWQLQVNEGGGVLASSTQSGTEAATGLAPYLTSGTVALTEPPTHAYFRTTVDAKPTGARLSLPDASGPPFALPDETYAYPSQEGGHATIVRFDSDGVLDVLDAPGDDPVLAAIATPTGNLVTLTGPGPGSVVHKWTLDGVLLWSTPVPDGLVRLASDADAAIYALGTVAGDGESDALLLKLRP